MNFMYSGELMSKPPDHRLFATNFTKFFDIFENHRFAQMDADDMIFLLVDLVLSVSISVHLQLLSPLFRNDANQEITL